MTTSEQTRLVAWRSRFLQEAENAPSIAHTCRRYGTSRQAYYKWRHRFDALGEVGLCDRSRQPKRSPQATSAGVISKILYLRENYHFGPGKIADYLKRFHHVGVAASTVHRVLQRHGLNRLPANQKHRQHTKRWQRYEKPQPSQRLQMDKKFLERIPGTGKRLYQLTAIDACRRIRVLKAYDACAQATAVRFADEVLQRLPFRVHDVQTDNGAEFQSRLHWHLESQGIRHVYIRPRTPRLNGKVERSHRVDDQEFYQLLKPQSSHDSRGPKIAQPVTGRHPRQHSPLQPETTRLGGLLQLSSPSRRLEGPDCLRTPHGESARQSVTELLRTYNILALVRP